MKKQILYLGDTALKEAASYLAGILTHHGLTFDYVPSDRPVESQTLSAGYRTIILSDYPAANFAPGQLEALAKQVRDGVGLLMIGGWESFTGLGRQYTDTRLADVLPIVMQPQDDRVNCPQPCLIEKNQEHEIIDGLPFEACPPGIGGYNQFRAKPEGKTILSTRRFAVTHTPAGFRFQPGETSDPLLVIGSHGKGRVAAFASDVAPHWVGGLVDWGDSRVWAQADSANGIEVGNWYVRFFANLIRWVAKSG